jgi:ribonuclease D
LTRAARAAAILAAEYPEPPDVDASAARPVLLASADALASFCEELRGAPYLALDTEFVRVRTYYPELCLIQVATPDRLACIDPLAGVPLAPLLERLHDPATTKVMHAGRQDLELFYLHDGRLPGPLYDTQIAASLLGHDDQVGYGRLVETLLGIALDKAHTRTDWAERPLSAEQLAYAAEDVSHLVTLYERTRAELADRGRLAWALEDAAALLDEALYRIEPETTWQRVKGHASLRADAQRAALVELAAWREREAMARNRPRQWLLRDAHLLAIARALPANRARLAQVPELPRPVVERYAPRLLEIVARAREAQPPPSMAVDPVDPALVDALAARVRERAAALGVPATVLAPRRELAGLLRGDTDLNVLRGWRAGVVGEVLQAHAATLRAAG